MDSTLPPTQPPSAWRRAHHLVASPRRPLSKVEPTRSSSSRSGDLFDSDSQGDDVVEVAEDDPNRSRDLFNSSQDEDDEVVFVPHTSRSPAPRKRRSEGTPIRQLTMDAFLRPKTFSSPNLRGKKVEFIDLELDETRPPSKAPSLHKTPERFARRPPLPFSPLIKLDQSPIRALTRSPVLAMLSPMKTPRREHLRPLAAVQPTTPDLFDDSQDSLALDETRPPSCRERRVLGEVTVDSPVLDVTLPPVGWTKREVKEESKSLVQSADLDVTRPPDMSMEQRMEEMKKEFKQLRSPKKKVRPITTDREKSVLKSGKIPFLASNGFNVQNQKAEAVLSDVCGGVDTEEEKKEKARLAARVQQLRELMQQHAEEEKQNKDRGKVVGTGRTRLERADMHAYDCPCCRDYYDALGLSEEERRERIRQVGKHRVQSAADEMPLTPEHYWEVDFPSESEQRRRGLIHERRRALAEEGKEAGQEGVANGRVVAKKLF